MLFIFSTPELIRNMWQLETAVFLHWCLLCAVPINAYRGQLWKSKQNKNSEEKK
jgi:hypothetical protein